MSETQKITETDRKYDLSSGLNAHKKSMKKSSQRKTNDDLTDTFNTSFENKLPINLLHSAAEYKKMLITNGRHRKKLEDSEIEGFVESLQFINDPIFESNEQRKKRASFRKTIQETPLSHKPNPNSFFHECSCKDNKNCEICTENPSSNKKIFQNQKMAKIVRQNKSTPKRSSKKKASKKGKVKVITSELQMSLQNIKNDFQKSKDSHDYLSQKKFMIDNLLCQSLIHFEEQKRQKKLNEFREKQKSLQKMGRLKLFDEEVRMMNEAKFNPKSRIKRSLSDPSKREIGKQYWKCIRERIGDQIKKDVKEGYSKSIIDHLKDTLKEDKQCKNHKPQVNPELMHFLRKKHEFEATQKIFQQRKMEASQKKRIKQHLQKLNNWQKQNRKSCRKQKFSPDKNMIDSAFMNLIEEQQSPQIHPKITKIS